MIHLIFTAKDAKDAKELGITNLCPTQNGQVAAGLSGAKDHKLQIVDHAPDSVTQMEGIEIDEYSESLTAQLKIRKELSLMDRRERINRLDFNHDKVFHQDIQSKPKSNLTSL